MAAEARDVEVSRAAALPGKSLALLAGLHVVPFAWGTVALPFRFSWLTLVLGASSLLHATVAVLALLGRQRELSLAWRVSSIASLSLLALVSWVAASSGLYLVELYRSVGPAVAFGLFAFWAIT